MNKAVVLKEKNVPLLIRKALPSVRKEIRKDLLIIKKAECPMPI